MAKLTKTQILNEVAEGAGISRKQAAAVLETLADLTYKHAGDEVDDGKGGTKCIGFTIPGIGKVTKRRVPAREFTLRFPPERAGEVVQKPATTKLKFTFLKAAKDAILG